MTQDYRFGIEEEFFVVDADSNAVQRRMPARFFDHLKDTIGEAVTVELLQSQLEIDHCHGSNVHPPLARL